MKVKIGKWSKKGNRKVSVKVTKSDVYSLDCTLAIIIHPALVKLKEHKIGSPWIEYEDVPEHLRPEILEDKDFTDPEKDKNFHARWDYVIDEMIWAFGEIASDNSEEDKLLDEYQLSRDRNDLNAYYERKRKALILFGKYFQNLWY